MDDGTTVRLTTAQALVRHLAALRIEAEDGHAAPYCTGVFAIFGHGNVAGIGEALWAHRDRLPTYRAHNEQAMAHAAIAYAKARCRRRILAVTTSIGPGATNLATAAALAHINRLPILLLPGDTFASRCCEPALQQLERVDSGDGSVNDALRALTRYFDRIQRPEQLLTALPQAIRTMTDPVRCGPACIALPQDVQAEAFDWPNWFLAPSPLRIRRPAPDPAELDDALRRIAHAQRPLLIAGGGVLYSGAAGALRDFAQRRRMPVAETQAGKSSLPFAQPQNLGAIGVTGSPAANAAAANADLIIAVGTRLQDFTTGSHALFADAPIVGINVEPCDATKWHATPLVADARLALQALDAGLGDHTVAADWARRCEEAAARWRDRVDALTSAPQAANTPPYEADVIGAVQASATAVGRDSGDDDIVVCAAGGLPGELHKLWRAGAPGGYHVEYGYSCMGYEIAGGLGVKLARPEQEVIVLVGDGSYLMMNSELATAVMLGRKLIVVVLDNRGFGCIERLQRSTGSAGFNNLLADCTQHGGVPPKVDFAAHARSLGVDGVAVDGVDALYAALVQARRSARTTVIAIETAAQKTTADGGCWWDVAVPETSTRDAVVAAHDGYRTEKRRQQP